MIYRRSKTVDVEHEGVVWTFNRPPGSVLLGWAPQVAELSNGADEGVAFPIGPTRYCEMLEDLAKWVAEVGGTPTTLTGDQLDSELLPQEGVTLWASFFCACQIDEKKRTQSDPPSD